MAEVRLHIASRVGERIMAVDDTGMDTWKAIAERVGQ